MATDFTPSLTAIRLRPAQLADAARLSGVAARIFEQTFGPHNDPSDMAHYLAEAFSPEKQRAELEDDRRAVWLLENESNEAIGYVSLLRGSRSDSVSADRPAEIERVYVDRPFHGQRLGDVLIDACIAKAKEWACDAVWLAVWEKNPRAIAFYEKRGFRRTGAKSFQLGTDVQQDFVMSLRLE